MTRKTLLLTLAILLFGACASTPELLPRSSAVPFGVDLSGQWELRESPGAGERPVSEEEQMIRLPPRSSPRQAPRRQSSRRSSDPSVHVFLESGRMLKITQTGHGLFISFDRAVVEEYTFGENRTVNVGPIEAQRVSGWDGEAFIVETQDTSGARLTEAWRLEAGGRELVRDISIVVGNEQPSFRRQRFDPAEKNGR